jgi:hypothetical protein
MRSTWLVFVVLGSVASGCDGCGGNGLPPPGNDLAAPSDMGYGVQPPDLSSKKVSFTQFAADYAQTLCAHYLACGQLDQAALDRCIEKNTRKIGWDEDTEIIKGRMEIDEALCLNALHNARCDNADTTAWTDKCFNSLFIPHQAAGMVCLGDSECINGYCAHSTVDGGATLQPTGCPGKCTAFKLAGAVCASDIECGLDSVCDVPMGATDGVTKCIKNFAVGDPCDPNSVAKVACSPQTSYCPLFGTGQHCAGAATQTQLHGPCDPNEYQSSAPACGAGMYCKVAAGGTSATCETKIASGQPCDSTDPTFNFDLFDDPCVDGTFCYDATVDDITTTAGTCQAYGGANDPCKRFTATASTCKQGYFCQLVANKQHIGTCQLLLLDDAACVPGQSNTCASSSNVVGTCVDNYPDGGTQTTCQPIKGFGVACLPGVEDVLCAPADAPGTAFCSVTPTGGVCAPKCF